MTNNKTNRGFTIVELLIVIVVIAILAAISIIAFNGIQDRARDTTAQETAAQLRQKIESYNAVKGVYPANIAALSATVGTPPKPEVPESVLDTALSGKIAPTSAVGPEQPIFYTPCSTPANGGTVSYWQKGTHGAYVLGACS